MSFPNGSVVDPDKNVTPVFKDFFIKSKSNAGLNGLKSFIWLLNLICEGKVPEQLKYFSWSKTYRPHKDRWRFVAECHRKHAQRHQVKMCRKRGFCRLTKLIEKFEVRCGTK